VVRGVSVLASERSGEVEMNELLVVSRIVAELRLIRLALERLSPPPETSFGSVRLQERDPGFKPVP
jgi:hypothetical protein